MQVSQQLREHYADNYTSGESEWRRIGAMAKADNIVALCSGVAHESIIEVGAGEGSILRRLRELGFGSRLAALEISASGVDVMRGSGIEAAVFDGYTMPHPDKSFDLVVMSHVVEHVEHPRALIQEAARVGKSVFIEVPLEDTIRLADNFVMDATGHINFYSPKTIRLLIQSCGLTVVGELITNRPRASYTFQAGSKGAAQFYIKEALLRFAPALATKLLTYHGSYLAHG